MDGFKDFDAHVREAMESWACPGAAIAVVRGDELVYEGAFGMRDISAGLAMTPDTRFPMASVTKSFIAMAAALLVDEGKLEWDKPVRNYMPEFILNDSYATENVTVRDMLSHRTGLPRHDFAAWRTDIAPEEFIKRLRHLEPNATFRERFQYNNLMYYAAGYLIEKLSGRPWRDFIHEGIFQPLGMDASNFAPEPLRPDQEEAKGYRIDRDAEGKVVDTVPMAPGTYAELSPGAAGALFSTLADMITWLKVHVDGGRAEGVQLVSPDSLKQMHLPQSVVPAGGIAEVLHGTSIVTYGMGWFVQPHRGSTLVHHGGNVEGHSVIVGFVPEEKVGVAVLTNAAAMPLRDVLFFESVDRALGLPEHRWNERYHAVYDPLLAGAERAEDTSEEERVKDAPPSHGPEDYTGTYEADGYPDLEIRLPGGAESSPDDSASGSTSGTEARDRLTLEARLSGSGSPWSSLRHYHYDVFEYHLAEFDQWLKVRFLTDDHGDIDGVSIPIEPAVDNVVFTRKQIVLDGSMLAAVEGTYDPSIDGLMFTVSVRQGKAYFTQTGGAPLEMEAYKLEPGVIGFAVDRVRLDFIVDGGAVTKLVLKGPMTLEAVRVP